MFRPNILQCCRQSAPALAGGGVPRGRSYMLDPGWECCGMYLHDIKYKSFYCSMKFWFSSTKTGTTKLIGFTRIADTPSLFTLTTKRKVAILHPVMILFRCPIICVHSSFPENCIRELWCMCIQPFSTDMQLESEAELETTLKIAIHLLTTPYKYNLTCSLWNMWNTW